MIHRALRCSDSNAFVCAAVRLVCHTGQAYSTLCVTAGTACGNAILNFLMYYFCTYFYFPLSILGRLSVHDCKCPAVLSALSNSSSMLPLVSGINSRLPSVNHALVSPIPTHPVLRVDESYESYFLHRFHRLTTLIIQA